LDEFLHHHYKTPALTNLVIGSMLEASYSSGMLWKSKITCSDVAADANIFSSFKVASLRSLNDDCGDMLMRLRNETTESQQLDLCDSDFRNDPTVDTFLRNYRMLPIAAKARIENWSIKANDIKTIRADAGAANVHATYHGLKVSTRVYTNDLNHDYDHGDGCLQTEIQAMAQLRHPNIIGFLGASISSKDCIVVTEFTPLGCLRTVYLCKQAKQPAWRPKSAQALAWALDLARAVTYLHQSDPAVIHRDLRPDTLLITTSGALKISGFRRCRILSGDERSAGGPRPSSPALSSAMLTSRGPYVAPEMLCNVACADAVVDIFAATMVMRFLRTGRDPPAVAAIYVPSGPRWGYSEGKAEGGNLGWGVAGRLVARGWAVEPSERPKALELAEALEAEVARRSACRLS
jgi:hypothetical protein